jgi:hypothetical protein
MCPLSYIILNKVITRGVAVSCRTPEDADLKRRSTLAVREINNGPYGTIQKGFFIVYVNLNFLVKKFILSLFRIQTFLLVRTRIVGVVSWGVADPYLIERIQTWILLLTLKRIRIRFSF